MQKISSFCEDKVFFQTPFFTDLLKLCCCYCASHLRFMQFHNLFQNFLIFCFPSHFIYVHMKVHRPENNELKWRFLYARHPRNFSHYLEHIKERDAKSYFPSDDHRSPFLLPRLSSEPMIISEITAKHKKAIRWDHHQALRHGNQKFSLALYEIPYLLK